MAAVKERSMAKSAQDLVCARCWRDFFDTEAFEKCCIAHHGGNTYNDVSIASIASVSEICDADCNWCAYVKTFFGETWTPDANVRTYLSPSHIESCTPRGQNVFYLSIDCHSLVGRWLGGASLFIHAWTTTDDIAATYVTARPVQTDVDSQAAKAQLRTWLEQCRNHHCCNDSFQATALPTRLIEVSPQGQQNPRLFESETLCGVYGTLSYCWGTDPFLTLTEANYNDLSKEIDLKTLPLTIQNAISIARNLSIPYLWVDALCIIQDSEQDKSRQVARMNNIYASSSLTIVAAATNRVHDGFLHQRSYSEPFSEIPARVASGKYGTMCVNELDAASYDERSEPLAKRAWALQEQLLSQRTLTYTDRTMMWRCQAGTRNFGDSMYFPHDLDSGYNEEDEKYSLNLNSLLLGQAEACNHRNKTLSCWLRLIKAYSLRSATLERDKLNALAGIVSHPSFFDTLGPNYYAGLWEYGFPRQLMWRTSSRQGKLAEKDNFTCYRPRTYRAPTWSWASLEGGIIDFDFSFDDDDDKDDDDNDEEIIPDIFCEVIECSATPLNPITNPFGEVAHAQLRISAPSRWAWICPSTYNVFLLSRQERDSKNAAIPPSDTKVMTFVDARTKHFNDFNSDCPDIDLTETPEATHGTDDRNMYGSCDETQFDEPMLVLCIAISRGDGVEGLLLVPSARRCDGSVYERIGYFERGRNEDFPQETNIEITII